MRIKILMQFFVITLFVGNPLFSMDSSTDEETQTDTELTIGSFIASQVAGARELMAYGRRAADDLIGISRQSETGETISPLDGTSQLLPLFLSNEAAYLALTRHLPREIRQLLAQTIQYYQPFKKIIQAKLGAHCSFLSLKHDSSVISARCNRPGDTMITACYDDTAYIWDVVSGQIQKRLKGHRSSVWSAEFNAREDRAVTASEDYTAKIWGVDSGTCFQTLRGHRGIVHSAVFNGAGDRIVTASSDHTAKLWDVASGNCLHTLQGNEDEAHAHIVYSAQFNEAGDRVITASEDRTVKLWDVASGSHLKTFYVEGAPKPQSAYFTRAGDQIVIGNFSKVRKYWTVHIINIESGALLFLDNERLLSSPESFPSGDKIITAYSNEEVKIRDVRSGTCLLALQSSQGNVYAAQFNVARNIIITASRSSAIQIFDAFSGQCLYMLKGPPLGCYPQQLAVTDDRIVVSNDSRVVIWDSKSLFAASRWLERDCTLEQALLLYCIYEARIIGRGLQKKYKKDHTWIDLLKFKSDPDFEIDPRFDFNQFPHLQKYFDTMPPLVQKSLESFVIRKRN